jgi:hypothetical protein
MTDARAPGLRRKMHEPLPQVRNLPASAGIIPGFLTGR